MYYRGYRYREGKKLSVLIKDYNISKYDGRR